MAPGDSGRRRPVPDELFGGRLKDAFLLELEVIAVVDHGPALRTISFASPDLVGFAWQPGQDVMLAVPGTDALRRRYTIRRADPEAGTLDIDVVLHGDGPFARWAAAAALGDRVDGIGPRGVITVSAEPRHHLFVGDETAIAVSAAMAEGLPPGASATILLQADEPPAAARPAVDATVTTNWLSPGELDAHLRSVPLPEGTVAYVNGERSLVRRAAAVLTERGLSPEAVRTKAYWRRDQPNAAHGEPAKD